MSNFSVVTALALLAAPAAFGELPEAQSPSRPLVIIDPGHGGKDWGATAKKLREKDLCLAIAKKLRDHLRADAGLPARLTREDDTFIPLDQRIESTLDWQEALFVSLHMDQDRNKKMSGMTIYAFGKSGQKWRPVHRRYKKLPPPPKEAAIQSAAFAKALATGLRSSGFEVDGTSKAEYYVLKNPEHPAVLIELGYLSNAAESAKLADPEYQDKIAAALARGLSGYMADARKRPGAESLAAR
ncbi:MAG: N-acetylmuramoyl-L-alanine amidase [Elusimicrobia bacterium]|nr:N-acetylmuramoyl-L-alanine amidase [Elusimicrobiota bacterium]